MKFSNYKRAVFYPLTAWLVFDLIAFLFGFTVFPDLSKAFLLSDVTPLFLSVSFGLWVGSESQGNFSIAGAARNAFIVSFVAGMVIVLFSVLLINYSPTFVTYVSSVYTNNFSVQQPIADLSISTWVGNVFVSTIAAVAIFTIITKSKAKK